MSKIIEKDEFIEVIDTSLGDVEASIDSSYLYLMLYRLYKKYGTIDGLKVRCDFDKVLDSILLSSSNVESDLKQQLWSYGVSFSENTMSNVFDTTTRRLLMIISEWTCMQDIIDVIDEKRKSGEYSIVPTDIFIENMSTNKEYDDITNIIANSQYPNITVWFFRDDINYYADFAEKDEVYHSKFKDSEIYNLTDELKSMFDVATLPYNIVDNLIQLGFDIYDGGFKCVEFNDVIPDLHFISSHKYYTMVASYLVYLSETYNFQVNATCDEAFSDAYTTYRKSSFCLAEDLFSNQANCLYPVMYYLTRKVSRFLYIRSVRSRYTYYYVRQEDLERMITGDTEVKMRKWSPQIISLYKDRGIIASREKLLNSEFSDYVNGNSDVANEPEIIPMFSVIETEEKLEAIVRAFNRYNANYSDAVMYKYVTARDILCRRDYDGDKEVIQIGFIMSKEDDSYDNRMAEDIIVSGVDGNLPDIASSSYFKLNRRLNCNLYNMNYIYDLGVKAPAKFISLLNDTNSWFTDVIDPHDRDENGERELLFSSQEKFLYYVYSQYMTPGAYNQLRDSLTGKKIEYKVALYNGVYSASEFLPEMIKYFAINDLIEADLLNLYGEINKEYIKSDGDGKYFDVKNKLFGIMKMNK